MKNLLIVIALSFLSLNAFAQLDVSEQALKTLMTKNPMTYERGASAEEAGKAADIMAKWMTSSIDGNKAGSLALIKNSCAANGSSLKCSLQILRSYRVQDKKGAFVEAESDSETLIVIEYNVDASGKKIIGKVFSMFAG